MKNLLSVILVTLILTGCTLFESQEKKSIKTVQNAKVQLSTKNEFANLLLANSGTNSTWLDFANMKAKEETSTQFEWSAKSTDQPGMFIVSFTNTSGMGYHWEVNIKQEIVIYINENDYLSRKYKFTRFDNDNNFQFENISLSKLIFDQDYSKNKKISYLFKAEIVNNTDKTWTDAKVSAKLSLIYKDKTVIGVSNWESGLTPAISVNSPWEPNMKKEIFFKTQGIESVYTNYVPEYVFFTVSINAEDPIGSTYNKDIEEIDLKERWLGFSANGEDSQSQNSASDPQANKFDASGYYIPFKQKIYLDETLWLDNLTIWFPIKEGEKTEIILKFSSDKEKTPVQIRFNKSVINQERVLLTEPDTLNGQISFEGKFEGIFLGNIEPDEGNTDFETVILSGILKIKDKSYNVGFTYYFSDTPP